MKLLFGSTPNKIANYMHAGFLKIKNSKFLFQKQN